MRNPSCVQRRSEPSQIRNEILVLCIALAFVVLTAAPLSAQYTTASLAGSVADSSGALVPGAKVMVRNANTGLARSSTTASDGDFLFPALPVGSYELTVEKNGFSTYVQKGIVLTVNQAATVSITLRVGAVSEQVTVAANASMLTTQTAAVSQLVDQARIVDLPLNGRQAQSLLFLAPGANNTLARHCPNDGCQGGMYSLGALDVPSGGETEASINGGGAGNVSYMMDGADHTDTYVNMSLPFPNPDAIQEFSLQTNNMSAEYGLAANVVNIVTKSGTNSFHGDAFEFVRNGDLNARNYFSPVQDTLIRNQFGGTFGGPIKKDRLFFFGTYQGMRDREAGVATGSFVPTAVERNGDFSAIKTQLKNPVTGAPFAANQIPTSLFSAPSVRLLQDLPVPTSTNGEVSYATGITVVDEDQFMPKIDYIRGKNQLSGLYFYTRFREPAIVPTTDLLTMRSGNQVKEQSVALSDNYTVSPTVLLSGWFGWDAQTGGNLSGAPFGYCTIGVNVPCPPGPAQFDELFVSGFFTLLGGHPGFFNRGDKTFRGMVTIERGSHELRFGGQAIRLDQNITNTNLQEGEYEFLSSLSGSNLADFMVGQVSTFLNNSGQYTNLAGTLFSLFAQDNWRVNQRFTLNLGLRWDPFWPYTTDTHNRIACFRPGDQSQRYPSAPLGLIFGGDPGCPAYTGYYSNLANFAPRFGFAYRLGQKTVLRGGVGIYNVPPQSSTWNTISGTAPFGPRITLTDVSFANPYVSAGVADPFPAAFGSYVPTSSQAKFPLPVTITTTVPSQWHVPTEATWNLMLDRQVGANLLLSASYVGDAGWDLFTNQDGELNPNPAIYIPGASTEANTQARRLYPDFGPISEFTAHNSNYNAFQLDVKRRFARGLTVWGNYTWSHQLDDYPPGGGGTLQTDSFDRAFDYGTSWDNIPNVFHLSGVWELPKPNFTGAAGKLLKGWALAPILTWQDGFPMTIYASDDNSFSSNGQDRADFLCSNLSAAVLQGLSHGQMVSEDFNTSCFGHNAVGTYGDTAKNILRAPGYFDLDLGLLKNTQITERLKLQFRAEAFNSLNNVNFSAPGVDVGTASFGKIGSASDPRILQFALKLVF